jgi:NAD(P)-dependent dehydrogenase (short-subunit alcohol dehydrogenase family)
MASDRNGTALITGGARRIGRAIALALAASGYAVVLHVRRSDEEENAVGRQIVEQGGRAHVVSGDLADAAAVEKIITSAAAFGPLTLLVNNAAEFDEDSFGELDRARFERTLAVNLIAPVFLARAGAGGKRNRKYRRSTRVQANASLLFIFAEQGRAARGDRHNGAGARAAAARQCGRARADAAEPAPERTRFRQAGGKSAARTRACAGGYCRRGCLSRAGDECHGRHDTGRWWPASRLAHAR